MALLCAANLPLTRSRRQWGPLSSFRGEATGLVNPLPHRELAMRLHSIPPTNRRPGTLARLSSMRAAGRVGLSIGSMGAGPSARPADVDASPRFHVIVPDGQAERERAVFRRTIAEKLRQLERLIAEAANSEEMQFWQRELERWR